MLTDITHVVQQYMSTQAVVRNTERTCAEVLIILQRLSKRCRSGCSYVTDACQAVLRLLPLRCCLCMVGLASERWIEQAIRRASKPDTPHVLQFVRGHWPDHAERAPDLQPRRVSAPCAR